MGESRKMAVCRGIVFAIRLIKGSAGVNVVMALVDRLLHFGILGKLRDKLQTNVTETRKIEKEMK